MSLKEFGKELTRGLKSPAYAIISTDSFLLSDAALSVKCAFRDDNSDIDDIDMLSSESKVSVNLLIDLLNMMSFMGGRRIVLVRHAEKLAKKDWQRLTEYLTNPSPNSLLMLFIEVADLRNGAIQPIAGLRSISLNLSPRELGLWLNSKATQLGYEFSPDALEYLIEITGDEPGLLNAEAIKFSYLNKKIVDKTDISGLVCGGAESGVFELTEPLNRGDIKETFSVYKELNETLETYQLFGALCWNYVTVKGKSHQGGKLLSILKTLHQADSLSKRSALCTAEMTLLKLLKVI